MKAIADIRKKLQNLVDLKMQDAELVLPDIIDELYNIEADVEARQDKVDEMQAEHEMVSAIEKERDTLQEELDELRKKFEEFENLTESLTINTGSSYIYVFTDQENLMDTKVFEALKELYEIHRLTPQQILERLNAEPATYVVQPIAKAAELPHPEPSTAEDNEPIFINDKSEKMHITVELTANPDLLQVLQTIAGNVSGKPAAAAAAKKETKAETPATPPAPSQNGTPVKKDAKIGVEKLREAVKAKSDAGKRSEIKALLGDFGVDKVTNLQSEQYADFLTAVEAL